MRWKMWGNPRHKPIHGDRVKEAARVKLLHLINLLEQRGDSPEEMERVVGLLREEALAGLNYHTMLLEEKLEIPKEDRAQPIPYYNPQEEFPGLLTRVKRAKKVKKVKEKKRPKRGGLFG